MLEDAELTLEYKSLLKFVGQVSKVIISVYNCSFGSLKGHCLWYSQVTPWNASKLITLRKNVNFLTALMNKRLSVLLLLLLLMCSMSHYFMQESFTQLYWADTRDKRFATVKKKFVFLQFNFFRTANHHWTRPWKSKVIWAQSWDVASHTYCDSKTIFSSLLTARS